MDWQFNDLQEMKDFSKYLSLQLTSLGDKHWAAEFNNFSYNSYPTPTEYLGELRVVLQSFLKEKQGQLSQEVEELSVRAVKAIDRAFGNSS